MLASLGRALVLPIFLAIVITYINGKFFKDQASVKVFISAPFTIARSSNNNAIEYAQQVSVGNQGSTEAKQISIKVPREVSLYTLEKHSSISQETTTNGGGHFELSYPTLPPDQKFSLVIRYFGQPLDPRLIEVVHSQGLALPALEANDQNSQSNFLWLFVGISIAFSTSMLFDFVKFQRNSFIKWSSPSSISQLVQGAKPWYISKSEWPSAHEQAIKEKISRDGLHDPHTSASAILLSADKPEHIDLAQWNSLLQDASNRYELQLSRAEWSAGSAPKFVELFRYSKPTNFSESDWGNFRKKLTSSAVDFFVPRFSRITQLSTILLGRNEFVSALPEAVQQEIKNAAYERCLVEINVHLFGLSNPEKLQDVLEGRNELVQAMPIETQAEIKKTAQTFYLAGLYAKLCNFQVTDIEKFLSETNVDFLPDYEQARFAKMSASVLRISLQPKLWPLSKELEEFVEGACPTWLTSPEFERLQKYVQASKDIDYARDKKYEAEAFAAKVTTQLSFINEILSDPSRVGRVEDYESTFSKGNYENLKRVAELLRK